MATLASANKLNVLFFHFVEILLELIAAKKCHPWEMNTKNASSPTKRIREVSG
jgi:hypothetical protein